MGTSRPVATRVLPAHVTRSLPFKSPSRVGPITQTEKHMLRNIIHINTRRPAVPGILRTAVVPREAGTITLQDRGWDDYVTQRHGPPHNKHGEYRVTP